MIFNKTPLRGAFIIELEVVEDRRGLFARCFCKEEFRANGLNPTLAQANISSNYRRGTLRGMHYQEPPHGEDKVVMCIRGSVFDVAVDLRPNSPTYLKWHGTILSAADHRMFYIPDGMAHGFVTLEDDTELLYLMSSPYVPGAARHLSWNDPEIGIAWPMEPISISELDRNHPDSK